MLRQIFLTLLICSCLVLCCDHCPGEYLGDICGDIVAWDSTNDRLMTDVVNVYFDAYVEADIWRTQDRKQKKTEKHKVYVDYLKEVREAADCYLEHKELIEKCHNDTLFVVLDSFKTLPIKKLSEKEEKQLTRLKEKVKIYFAQNVTIDGESYRRDPDLIEYMKQRDYGALWRGWEQYHDDATAELKDDYVKIVKLTKKSAQNRGFADLVDQWLTEEFNDTSMEKYMDQLYRDMFPLFTKVHAYVRSTLFDFYKDQVPDDHKHVFKDARNTIPVHILGDMSGQEWTNLEDLLLPYPDEEPINLTKILIEKNYNTMKLFKLSESFFTSLGFDPMTDTFWDKSYFDHAGVMECIPSAYDMYAKDDYRITMCTQIDDINYYAVHHEMGHIVNFMLYKDQPYIWKGLATKAFSEAVGDTIILSARSRKHLETIGFLDKSDTNDQALIHKQRMNYLMHKALFQMSLISFMYVAEKWRFAVFRGEIAPKKYNKKWWELRKTFSGVSSPVQRPNDGFDIGSKYHIPNQVSFFRYFYSFIGQFQFHETLCKAAGQTEDFDNCDIYNSKAAGQKLRDFLSPGKSRPWRELLHEFTGDDNFQSTAIANYFKPLDEWLTGYLEENNIAVGWDGMWDMKLDGGD